MFGDQKKKSIKAFFLQNQKPEPFFNHMVLTVLSKKRIPLEINYGMCKNTQRQRPIKYVQLQSAAHSRKVKCC